MDEISTLAEFEKNDLIFGRRRDMLPIWIKIFVWIFMITGVLAALLPLVGLMMDSVDLTLYGLSATEVYSFVGLLLVFLFILKGVVAYGLWFEKNWAPMLAISDAVIGILLCLVVMLILPFIIGGTRISLRLELIFLIPYLIKMRKIKNIW